MAWCKAFAPIDESPPWRPDPHAPSRRAHARTQAARRFAQTISARAHTNPGQLPCHPPLARTSSLPARPNPTAGRRRRTSRRSRHVRTRRPDTQENEPDRLPTRKYTNDFLPRTSEPEPPPNATPRDEPGAAPRPPCPSMLQDLAQEQLGAVGLGVGELLLRAWPSRPPRPCP